MKIKDAGALISWAYKVGREHGVLERAVVELHHVRPGNALAAQPPREIYVDYIEASRAER